jgi:O-antigen/teichoic acid export membrane protein
VSTRIETLPATQVSAPTSGWRRLFADWTIVGSATVVCHALGAVNGLLLRMFLSPAQMGIFSALKLFLSYGNYANFGVSKGAVREFNVATGHGDTRAARHGLNLAFTVNTVSSLLYAALLCGVGVWIVATGGGVWAGVWGLGLMAVGLLAVLGRYVTFHVTILRASQAFAVTSRLSVLEAVLTLTVCPVAAWCWGLPGLLSGLAVVAIGSLVFVRCHAAATLRWAWDSVEIRRLVAIGGPILLIGAASSLFRSLDKLMILGLCSNCEYQLGCYSVAVLVGSQVFGLGNMMAMVTAPRFGEQYGRLGDRRRVARLTARVSELQAAAIVLPAGLAIVVVPPLLAWLLPDYQSGLPSLRCLVPGAVFMTLALPGSQYLVAINCQQRALVAVLLATAVGAAGNFVAIRGGFGLMGVAAATAIGYAIYWLLIVGMSLWRELDAAGRLRYVVMLAVALAPTLGAALLLDRTNKHAVAANTAAVVLVWMLTVALGCRWGKWLEELKERS